MAVVIETTLGDLSVDLFVKERPQACLNFLKLCKLKYYNFNLFHNIEHGFIAQTGDPTGVGDGGESVWGVIEGPHKKYFEAESLPKIKHTVPGLVSMVSVGNDMVGSQFFFTLGPDLTSLDGVHCVIGEVAEGIDVLRKINESIVDEKYRPYQDIRITHTVILEDPFDDPRGFQIPSRSPSPTAERLKNGRIGADEDIDDTEGKSVREIQEMLQEREAKARATILEIVGDLPDADIAPPENVLFVCKLNPVTTDDDLEIIFSRFGKVKSCEVIRDKVSGDSLQYAFVEFEDKKSCEKAYFKMDNVLIDDRRIHVDFSQSVAKVRWRGKGRGVVRSDGKDGGKLDFSRLRESDRSENHSRSYKAKNGSGKEASTAKGSHSRSRHNFNDSQRRERRRSRSREREQNVRQRSSSRSPQNHERNSPARSRHADKSNRSRHRSRTLSPKYDKNNRYRDENTRRVETSSRSNYNRERYENVRQDNRKYHKSRSGSRSPRRTGSSHYHDAQEKQKYQGSRSEYGRRDEERKKTTESNSRSSRQEQTNSSRDNRTERMSEHSSRSSKHGESKQKELKKRHERSKEESLTSSDESSSQSSSSSYAAHKRKKKPPKKKSSKKKRRKNSSSSSSDSSTD